MHVLCTKYQKHSSTFFFIARPFPITFISILFSTTCEHLHIVSIIVFENRRAAMNMSVNKTTSTRLNDESLRAFCLSVDVHSILYLIIAYETFFLISIFLLISISPNSIFLTKFDREFI